MASEHAPITVWSVGTTTACLAATVAVFVGGHGSGQGQGATVLKARSLRARRFVVENTEGKTLARVEGTAMGATLQCFAKDGTTRILLACAASGKTIIKLNDAKGKARTVLATAPQGKAGLWVFSGKGAFSASVATGSAPVLRLPGRSGRDLLLLGVREVQDRQDSSLEVRGAKGNGIGLLARGNGNGAVVMQDSQGVPRVVLLVPPPPRECGITIWDASGKAALGMHGLREGKVWLRMRDRIGHERVALGTDLDGQTSFIVKDESGRVVAGESR